MRLIATKKQFVNKESWIFSVLTVFFSKLYEKTAKKRALTKPTPSRKTNKVLYRFCDIHNNVLRFPKKSCTCLFEDNKTDLVLKFLCSGANPPFKTSNNTLCSAVSGITQSLNYKKQQFNGFSLKAD